MLYDLCPARHDNAQTLKYLLSIDNGFPGACAGGPVGKILRDFALKPPIAVEADRTVFALVDPEHSTDQGLLNSCVGVAAALKRAVEGQPAAGGRSFQVVIDGERTGQ